MVRWQLGMVLVGLVVVVTACDKETAHRNDKTAATKTTSGQQCQHDDDCAGARTCVRLRCLTPSEYVIDAYTHALAFFDTHHTSSCKVVAEDPKLAVLAAEVSKANVGFIEHYRPLIDKGTRPPAFERGVTFVNDALKTLQARLRKITSTCDEASSNKLKTPVSQLMMNDLRAPSTALPPTP